MITWSSGMIPDNYSFFKKSIYISTEHLKVKWDVEQIFLYPTHWECQISRFWPKKCLWCPLLPSARTRTLSSALWKHAKDMQRMGILHATLILPFFFLECPENWAVPAEFVNTKMGILPTWKLHLGGRSSLWPHFCWPYTSAKTHHLLCDTFIIYCFKAQSKAARLVSTHSFTSFN